MTSESVAIRVRSLLAARGQDVSNLRNNRILALIPDALRALVDHGQLRKSFSITAVNGEVDLAAALADAEPLILEGLTRAVINFDGYTYPAQFKSGRSSMSYPASSEFVYWTLEDTKMLVSNGDGLGTFDGDGDIRNAPFVALLSSVTKGSEMAFIQILGGLCSAKSA